MGLAGRPKKQLVNPIKARKIKAPSNYRRIIPTVRKRGGGPNVGETGPSAYPVPATPLIQSTAAVNTRKDMGNFPHIGETTTGPAWGSWQLSPEGIRSTFCAGGDSHLH